MKKDDDKGWPGGVDLRKRRPMILGGSGKEKGGDQTKPGEMKEQSWRERCWRVMALWQGEGLG